MKKSVNFASENKMYFIFTLYYETKEFHSVYDIIRNEL